MVAPVEETPADSADQIFGEDATPAEAEQPAEARLTAEQLFGPDATEPAEEETPLHAAQIFGEEPAEGGTEEGEKPA